MTHIFVVQRQNPQILCGVPDHNHSTEHQLALWTTIGNRGSLTMRMLRRDSIEVFDRYQDAQALASTYAPPPRAEEEIADCFRRAAQAPVWVDAHEETIDNISEPWQLADWLCENDDVTVKSITVHVPKRLTVQKEARK